MSLLADDLRGTRSLLSRSIFALCLVHPGSWTVQLGGLFSPAGIVWVCDWFILLFIATTISLFGTRDSRGKVEPCPIPSQIKC